MKTQHWPGWAYGPKNQSAIFNSREEIPEGWHDHPSKVGDPKAVTDWHGPDEAAEGAEPIIIRDGEDVAREERETRELAAAKEAEEAARQAILDAEAGEDDSDEDETEEEAAIEEVAGIDAITKEEIVSRLKSYEVTFNPSWNKEKLYQLLLDHLKGE